MKKIITKILIFIFFFISLNGCKSITKLTQAFDEESICLTAPALQDDLFYATGSAYSLEQAKSNARQDLVLQISSDVSSKIENKTTDKNGHVNNRSSSWIQSESSSIPVDQHKVIETCKTDGTYFIAITLKKQSLIDSTELRLKKEIKESKKLLNSVKRGSLYEKYIVRQTLDKKLSAINAYTQILTQYAHKPINKKTAQLIKKLETFIINSGKLVVGIQSDRVLSPLQDELEQALNKAKLEYKRGSRRTVAVIKLKARQNNRRKGKLYIVKLKASLDVSRGDNNKLLSRYHIDEVVKTSTVSYKLALQSAQSLLGKRLKTHLNGDAEKIRKILGLE